jgi:hypothetical protein
MTAMTLISATRTLARAHESTRSRASSIAFAIALIIFCVCLAGCGTEHPHQIAPRELAEAQTFPYYRTYWAGPTFQGHPLAAADGLRGYIEKIGDSVYYGDCVQSKGIFGGGSCLLPLQVTTVFYRLHSNAPLGPQHNILLRDVPATVYDEGRSIEIYTGRVAVDVFSDAMQILPLNAPGSAGGALPAPVYCPGLSGAVTGALAQTMANLPGRSCQHDAAQVAYTASLEG